MSHGFLTAPHHLHDAAGVPEVDEDNAAVVPAPRYPAGQHHVLPGVRSAQCPRLMGADHRALPFSFISSPIFAYSPRRGPDSGVSPVRNGLVRRSAPMLVCGPCPDSTTVSSGRVRQTRAKLRRIVG